MHFVKIGSNLALYFFKWVESPSGGNGGDKWVDDHIESFISLAGSFLGAPKSVAALLSGETRDTVSVGSFGAYLLEKFFSRQERANLLRTWAGGSSLLPKGGDAIWGTDEDAPDDDNINNDDHVKDKKDHSGDSASGSNDGNEDDKSLNKEEGITDEIDKMIQHATTYKHTHGKLLSFLKRSSQKSSSLFSFNESNTHSNNEKNQNHTNEQEDDEHTHYTLDEAMDLLRSTVPKEYTTMLQRNYSLGITTSKKQLKKNNDDYTKWANPLESQLPIGNTELYRLFNYQKKKKKLIIPIHITIIIFIAPNMKIYCLYGVGIPTERSYHYTYANQIVSTNNCSEQEDIKSCLSRPTAVGVLPNEGSNSTIIPELPLLYIDKSVNDGIQYSDGDGTVPLLSLGYMCSPKNGAWTKYRDLYNPGHSPVTIKEYLHEPSDSKLNIRGGGESSDHVDILGHVKMILDILQILSNKSENVTEQIISKIEQVAEKIKLDPKP
ncbi:Lecithin:cholesterol acyltransferase-domain-containing protein [Cunninghamella echinulata]|nr:Lecithin:cholesterol acyltransferase-domain-containing protein [Cunninghamella echinulata]